MKKGIVYYYSNTNNNQYLAKRVAEELKYDIEEIKPRCKVMPYLIFSTLTGISFGIKPLVKKPVEYKNIVISGPVWMGSFISPLKDLVKKNKEDISRLFFITCCGSSHEDKESKFGYENVFKKVRKTAGEKLVFAQALPVSLVIEKGMEKNSDAVMKAKLSDNSFKGQIKKELLEFVKKVKEKKD